MALADVPKGMNRKRAPAPSETAERRMKERRSNGFAMG
jgi:hypothetical protein